MSWHVTSALFREFILWFLLFLLGTFYGTRAISHMRFMIYLCFCMNKYHNYHSIIIYYHSSGSLLTLMLSSFPGNWNRMLSDINKPLAKINDCSWYFLKILVWAQLRTSMKFVYNANTISYIPYVKYFTCSHLRSYFNHSK